MTGGTWVCTISMQTYCLHARGQAFTVSDTWQTPAAHASLHAHAHFHPSLARQACQKQQRLAWSSHSTGKNACTRNTRLTVSAQAGSSSRQRKVQQIPIFPLGMVALPGAVTPLNIFEARLQHRLCLCFADAGMLQVAFLILLCLLDRRYRVLFSTLLAGDDG